MKTVYLIRHAKSSWKNPELDDYKRPLNQRGKKNAQEMGERLALAGILPDFIVSSPAKRARSTARRIAKRVGYPKKDIVYNRDLYLSDCDIYLDIIEAYLHQVQSIAIVGHNMVITELAEYLTGRHYENIVTCGLVALSVEYSGTNTLQRPLHCLFYDYPQNANSPLLLGEYHASSNL